MIKDIREELPKYKEYIERVNNINVELNLIEELVGYGVEGIDYDQIGGSSGKISDIVADITHNKDIKTRSLEAEKKILQAKISLIENCMGILSNKQRYCIQLKYRDGYSWKEVAEEVDITYNGVYSLRDSSMDKMQDFIDKGIKKYKKSNKKS